MSGAAPEGPDIRDVEAEEYFSVTEQGIIEGSFKEAATNGFRELQNFSESNQLLGKHNKVIGVSPDDPIKVDTSKCRYICCMRFDSDDMKTLDETDKVKRYTTEKGKYAVFTHKGPHEKIQKSYQWIVENYLPKAAFAYRKGSAPYECYLNDPATTKEEALVTEIYIPVLRREKPKEKFSETKEVGNEESKDAVVEETKEAVVEETKEAVVEETKEAVVEETKEAVVEETKEAVVEETKEAVVEETKEAVVEETKEAVVEETKEAVNEEIKDAVDEEAVNEEIKDTVDEDIKEAVDEEKKEEAIVQEKKE